MSPKPLRFTALLLILSLALPACSTAAAEKRDSGQASPSSQESAADISDASVPGLEAIPVMVPEPEPEPEPVPVLTQADIDQALEQVMEHYSAAGVSVAAIEDGFVTQSGAWGWAVKDKREMTPDTKIRIASISKVVVGMAAMAMAEDGLVDLDAPLSDYWGEEVSNPYGKGQPSVRTLMTHTSSIKNLETTRGLSKLKGLLRSKSSWRNMEPGNGGYWYYSNFGLCVLGTTLELASGQILDDYLQSRLLEPIGAEGSFYGGRLEEDQLAMLYQPSAVGRTVKEQHGVGPYTEIGKSAALFPGGFTVSAVDLAKLVSVLANDGFYKQPVCLYTLVTDTETGEEIEVAEPIPGKYKEVRLLTEASVSDMETPRFTVEQEDYSPFEQCLILRRQEDVLGQEAVYYHTGSAYGVFSLMTYNPETKNGVVVLTTGTPRNMNERGMYALCYDLMEILYDKMEADPA